MKYFKVVTTCFLFLNSVNGLNILIVVGWFANSHFLAFARLFRHLAEKDHNVTVLSYYPDKKPVANYRNVEVENLDTMIQKMKILTHIGNVKTDKLTMYQCPHLIAVGAQLNCETVLQSKNVQEFIRERNDFDLILLEDFFSDCFWPLVQMYNCPVIRLISHILTPWHAKHTGNPLSSAFVANIHLKLNVEMSFFERMENFLMNSFDNFYYDNHIESAQKELARKYLPVNDETYDSSVFNVSLVLLNTHYTLNIPRPLVPNIIEVGGIHIGETKKLPEVSSVFEF